MRVSVTLSDENNSLITQAAKDMGISKDRFIGIIIDDWIDTQRKGGNVRKHNERGAGRKKEYSEAHKLAMRSYKANGMSYRDIAKIYNCSVGTVHKLINESE